MIRKDPQQMMNYTKADFETYIAARAKYIEFIRERKQAVEQELNQLKRQLESEQKIMRDYLHELHQWFPPTQKRPIHLIRLSDRKAREYC